MQRMHGDRGGPGWSGDQPIGMVIEETRSKAGKSQEMLAEALRIVSGTHSVNRDTVSRWENSKRIPVPYWRRHLSTVLRIPIEVLDRAAAISRAQRAGTRLARRTAPDEVDPREASPQSYALPATSQADRDLVAAGAGEPEAQAVLPLVDERSVEIADRLGAVVRGPGRVDEMTVSLLEEVTDSHRNLYHTLSSIELIHFVRGHLQGVIGLLRGHQPAALRRRLAAIACETAGHAAWLAHDLDDPNASKRYYAAAIVVGREAGDPALDAYVRGFMSIVHRSRRQPAEALMLAQNARDEAVRSATATTRSWLEALVAQEFARHGDVTACLASLKDAERALENSRPDQDPAWQYSYDQSRFYASAGGCYRNLGMTAPAERILLDALAMLDPSCARRRSEVLLELAHVGLQRHDIDQACSYAAEALDGMIAVRSIAGVQQIRQFRVSLEPWRDAVAVARFDERLFTTL